VSFLILKGHDQVFILSGLCKNFISMTAISLLMPSLGLWNSRPKAFGVKHTPKYNVRRRQRWISSTPFGLHLRLPVLYYNNYSS
jgi:hypothetical protein